MKRNFAFAPATVVRWNDRLIDLHNAYDVEAFSTDYVGDEVSLRFVRNEHALDPTLPLRVTLTCTGKVKVAFNDLGTLAAPLNEEGMEIAYFDEACDWPSFLDEDVAEQHDPLGLHISFVNGLVIRIRCDLALLSSD